ncbi:MAG: tetratricopeptide repeat protein, partial [Gammaproteobacteria bacterium]
PAIGLGAGELSISRTVRAPAVDADVQRGYDAYRNGELDAAESHYRAALAANATNHHARLGLGAVARARGDVAGAWRHYQAVLKEHPRDPVASAAVFALTGAQDERQAARLRLLLDEHAETPVLHFTLGNYYARQQRWGDAQQAYFEAMRRDGGNADYAYNLAVSLDHLGQAQAAVDYYQKSLSLADAGSASFNPAAALERINALSKPSP